MESDLISFAGFQVFGENASLFWLMLWKLFLKLLCSVFSQKRFQRIFQHCVLCFIIYYEHTIVKKL